MASYDLRNIGYCEKRLIIILQRLYRIRYKSSKTRICYPQNAVLLGVKPLKPLKPQEITRFQDFRPFSLSTPVSTPLSTLCPSFPVPLFSVSSPVSTLDVSLCPLVCIAIIDPCGPLYQDQHHFKISHFVRLTSFLHSHIIVSGKALSKW